MPLYKVSDVREPKFADILSFYSSNYTMPINIFNMISLKKDV